MELAQARKARIVPRTGGRALADALVAQGIDHVFAVPGESYLDVLDGLYDVRQKLKLVTCRFEAGAVNMAEAFGKLKGRPAAAMVPRGPGACHGALDAHLAMQATLTALLFAATARSACMSRCRTARRCCCSSGRSHTKTPGAMHSRRWTIAGCSVRSPSG
jgi:hypothetical protein